MIMMLDEMKMMNTYYDDNDDEDNDDISYSVSIGNNERLVYVNNLIDYINRPDQFKEMCWY